MLLTQLRRIFIGKAKLIASLLILLSAVATNTSVAHTYFFGVTDITVNAYSHRIEVIHQFTAHDIENVIAETKQINLSPEHPKYDLFIQQYFEQHFSLLKENKPLQLTWIGFEIKLGKIIAYQESLKENNLLHLVVKNELLVDTYHKQINTVNFQGNNLLGSLTFSNTQKVAQIK